MNDSAIALSPTPDFSGMRLTQSSTGHVQSPWFTFPQETCSGLAQFSDLYQRVRMASGEAFGRVTGRGRFNGTFTQLLFHEKVDPETMETWWRWSTALPCKLPVPTPKVRDPLAIDV